MTATNLENLIDAADLSDRTDRLVLADALEEAGREDEAATLRDTDEPAYLIDNRIMNGRDAIARLDDFYGDGTHAMPYGLHDDGSPQALIDAWGRYWGIYGRDGETLMLNCVSSDHLDEPLGGAAIGKWLPGGLIRIEEQENGATYGVNCTEEFIVRDGVWCDNDDEEAEDDE